MPLIDRENLRAVVWAVLVGLLVVLVSGVLIGLDTPPSVVVPVALFVLPLAAALPFMLWRAPKTGR